MTIRRIAAMIVLLLLVAGLGLFQYGYEQAVDSDQKEINVATQNVSFAVDSSDSRNLRDNFSLYERNDPTQVVTMYLTVRQGIADENTDHTWDQVNTYTEDDYKRMGVAPYQASALLQVGNESGPVAGELGYGETAPNAVVQIRGQTSTYYSQKNYKIEIKNNHGSWNGQTTIALNKHNGEGLRFRNKLAYDLMSGIPQMMSLQTQFVHLFVNDLTDGSDDGFEDYGLYTQVEQLNRTALKAHGLDRTGHLYKINYFEFYRYEDAIRMADDPEYDLAAFERYLEVKGDTDHSKLIAMLEDVNDYSIPIEDVIAEHFNLENLTYWMAFHILTGNVDTQNRNFYLYSPQNLDTWYIYSWDNDDSFMYSENQLRNRIEYGGWAMGVSNYSGNVLFRRCLKSDAFRAALDAAVSDVLAYMTDGDRLQHMADAYSQVVKPYVFSIPDITYEPITSEEYDRVESGLQDEVEVYYQNYLESLKKPLPFYIGDITYLNGTLSTIWDASYDFDAEDITYTVTIARDYEMRDVVASYDSILTQLSERVSLSPGQYFLQVQATDSSGNSQVAFDYYTTENRNYFGMKSFYINPDGTLSMDTPVTE